MQSRLRSAFDEIVAIVVGNVSRVDMDPDAWAIFTSSMYPGRDRGIVYWTFVSLSILALLRGNYDSTRNKNFRFLVCRFLSLLVSSAHMLCHVHYPFECGMRWPQAAWAPRTTSE